MAKRTSSGGQTITSGPWTSVYNASDLSEAYQNTLYSASNVYKPKGGNSFTMRPPFFVTKAAGTLGTAGSRFGDAMIEHTTLAGTVFRFVFVGGKVYRWDGATTYVDVTPASPVISSANPRVFACSFADNLVVSDGVHRPWYVPASGMNATPLVAIQIDYDGLGTIWTAQGAPVVYDARLFFILSSVGGLGGFQDTIIWSEVDDPTTGYKQTNFADFWELSQTDGHPIYALAPTEMSLVVFRAQSILNITGKTDTAFATNATRESIEGVGTTSPNSVVVHNGVVWFLDQAGRQYRYQPGQTPEALWTQMADTIAAGISNLSFGDNGASAMACYHPDLNLIISGAYGPSVLAGTVFGVVVLHVFDAVSGQYQGTWDVDGLKTVHAIAAMRSLTAVPALCILGESVGATNLGWTLATSGQMWRQRIQREMGLLGYTYSDPSGVPNVSVTTHHLGRNEDGDWIFDQLTLRAVENNANTAGCTIPLTYYTPRSSSTPPTAVLTKPPTTPINAAVSGFQGEARAVWGLGPNARGRWLMAKLSAPTAAQTVPPFTPTAVALHGRLTKANPYAP